MRIQYRYIEGEEGWPEIHGEVRVRKVMCYNSSSTTEEEVKDRLKRQIELEVYNGLAGKLVALRTLIVRNFVPLAFDSIQVLDKELSSLFDSLRLEE